MLKFCFSYINLAKIVEQFTGKTVFSGSENVYGAGIDFKKGYDCRFNNNFRVFVNQNKEKKRNPEAHQTKKGNTWHFGYKAHIGVDKNIGLVHSIEATSANVHNVTVTPKQIHGEEETVNGDSGYIGADKRDDAVIRNKNSKKIKY